MTLRYYIENNNLDFKRPSNNFKELEWDLDGINNIVQTNV